MRNQSETSLNYIQSLFAQETTLHKKIRQKLIDDNKSGMSLQPYEGQFIKMLLLLNQCKKGIEVGTLYGYSTLWISQALPKNGQVFSLEKSKEHFAIASSFLQNQEKIQLHLGDSLTLLDQLTPKGPFDFIFIDANKSGYLDCLNWAEKNIRQGGLIIGDNTFLFGHVYNEGWQRFPGEKALHSIKTFNERLSDPDKYESLLFPTSEGLTIALKKF